MNSRRNFALVGAVLIASIVGGCAAGHVKPADKDTSGTYDGDWIGSVSAPRASTVILPGNWRMGCDWEPFQIAFTVDDGNVQLGRIEQKTPVSKKGKFRVDLVSGDASMRSGVMSGNGKFVQIFSGSFSGSEPAGKYLQYISSLATTGCSAKMQLHRKSDSVN